MLFVTVCCLKQDKILLIRKNRPEFQKGRLNYVGGKVEPNEIPQDAALREFHEETGNAITNVEYFGSIVGPWGRIYCYNTNDEIGEIVSLDEKVDWYRWDEVKEDPSLMPNLKLTVPLIMAGVKNWIVDCTNADLNKSPYTIEVSLA